MQLQNGINNAVRCIKDRRVPCLLPACHHGTKPSQIVKTTGSPRLDIDPTFQRRIDILPTSIRWSFDTTGAPRCDGLTMEQTIVIRRATIQYIYTMFTMNYEPNVKFVFVCLFMFVLFCLFVVLVNILFFKYRPRSISIGCVLLCFFFLKMQTNVYPFPSQGTRELLRLSQCRWNDPIAYRL